MPLQVLDICANQGDWTLSLLSSKSAKRRANGRLRIDAVEPVGATAGRFEAALSAVPSQDTVHLHRYAISDHVGEMRIAITSAMGDTNTLHFDQTNGEPPGGGCQAGLHGIGHIQFAKCDAEGHDLMEAHELLAAGRIDVFQFEYSHRWVLARAYLKRTSST